MSDKYSFIPSDPPPTGGDAPSPLLPDPLDPNFDAYWYGNGDATPSKEPSRSPDAAMRSLLALLEDNDEKVASTAIAGLLQYKQLDDVIAANQDADDPAMRRHIHQIAVITEHRRIRRFFLEEFKRNTLMPWDALLCIQVLMDTRRSLRELEQLVNQCLPEKLPSCCQTADVVKLMRSLEISLVGDEEFISESFMIGEALDRQSASTIVLAILAQHVGLRMKWLSSICMSNGHFCLLDQEGTLIDIEEEWKMEPADTKEAHVCTRREVIYTLLSYLLSSAILSGNLYDQNIIGSLLADIEEIQRDAILYPQGSFMLPKDSLENDKNTNRVKNKGN